MFRWAWTFRRRVAGKLALQFIQLLFLPDHIKGQLFYLFEQQGLIGSDVYACFCYSVGGRHTRKMAVGPDIFSDAVEGE